MQIQKHGFKVMVFNEEHVLYRNINGLHFIGMATIFNEIHIRNIMSVDFKELKELKPTEKPKQWVYDFGPTFQQMDKGYLEMFIIN